MISGTVQASSVANENTIWYDPAESVVRKPALVSMKKAPRSIVTRQRHPELQFVKHDNAFRVRLCSVAVQDGGANACQRVVGGTNPNRIASRQEPLQIGAQNGRVVAYGRRYRDP